MAILTSLLHAEPIAITHNTLTVHVVHTITESMTMAYQTVKKQKKGGIFGPAKRRASELAKLRRKTVHKINVHGGSFLGKVDLLGACMLP